MRGNQQVRRIQTIARQPPKTTIHATHALLTTNARLAAVSRQRDSSRNLRDRSQNKTQQCEPTKPYKHLVSRAGRDNPITKLDTHLRRPIPNAEHMHETNRGISIHVNIENLITPKVVGGGQGAREAGHSQDRCHDKSTANNGVSNEPARQRRVSHIKTEADCYEFECNEEIVQRRPKVSPVRERMASRTNFDPKHLLKDNKQFWQKQKPRDQKPKQRTITPQELIKKYEHEVPEINNLFNTECLLFLDSRQNVYKINEKYIELWQPNFNWKMRAQMMEWMMQVAYEYSLKRQTYHIAVNLVDRFLQKEKNLPKTEFQLVGAAAMFIASKLEQFEPKCSEDFVKTTGRAITAAKLKQMQKRICAALEYKLNPPTLYRWANRLMVQWDSYIRQNEEAKTHPIWQVVSNLTFKQCEQDSYANFRVLMQLIDCSTLDVQTYIYNPKLVVLGFMYLYLGKETKYFTVRDIVHTFPSTSLYLLDEENIFNQIFNQFLQFSFGFILQDLLPTIQYCASYFLLPPNVDMPASKHNPEAYENMELEEYCSFQTYDRNMYPIVVKRFRDIYL